MKSYRICCLILPALLAGAAAAETTVSGNLEAWNPLTLDVNAPAEASSESANDNPFLDYRLDVTFTSPSGTQYVVPGFFAGDGDGDEAGDGSGSIWRARFSPGETGSWQYSVSFRKGANVAVNENQNAGSVAQSNGDSGNFVITAQSANTPGLLPKGRLGYAGKHYLQFADGDFFIKGGVDSPENFFGFAGFDNTVDQVRGVNTEGLQNGLHQYQTHVSDWNSGDPDFSNRETGASGRGIIGAINYLSSQGVNSIYFLPMNLGGDGRDTYPFVSATGTGDADTRYDVSKLYQWNLVLNHMQEQGIAAHIVLGEQESRNTAWLDDGSLGNERKLFYREMVARFSYLMAVKWNISEESRYTTANHREFADYIRSIDWAQHPIAVHTHKDDPAPMYNPLLGNMSFASTSLQFSPENAGTFVEEWREKSNDAGWPLVIEMDEVGPAKEGLTTDNADELRKSVLYPVYFSGGNIEWYFGYHPLPMGGDMRTENFRTRESMYRYMKIAREFMHDNLPFWNMEPLDSAYQPSAASATGEVFAVAGKTYALYLPNGNTGGNLAVQNGEYSVRWYDPRQGRFSGAIATVSGNSIAVGTPPSATGQDWIMLVKEVPTTTTGGGTTGGTTTDSGTTGGTTTDGGTTGGTTTGGGTTGGTTTDSGTTGGTTTDGGTTGGTTTGGGTTGGTTTDGGTTGGTTTGGGTTTDGTTDSTDETATEPEDSLGAGDNLNTTGGNTTDGETTEEQNQPEASAALPAVEVGAALHPLWLLIAAGILFGRRKPKIRQIERSQ